MNILVGIGILLVSWFFYCIYFQYKDEQEMKREREERERKGE